ncbi:MAG TPA: transcription antitermination factor NusB [Myxococcota bacterium]|nr:transcription antitermination factor NusB [Myxococcota bacterium]HOA13274.1 transcription antitermination factor NusB [Myxococcota bacterium]HOH76878.1 transcription antitermination factor NusB [Myxococcota bacterium]
MKRLTGDSRTDAAIILEAVLREHQRSTDLTNQAAGSYRDQRDFGLLRELVGGVLRRMQALEAIVGPHVGRGLENTRPLLKMILLGHAYQAVFLDRIPAHARVSGAVNAARRLDGEKGAGFVNAVTRSVERLADGNPGRLLDGLTPWQLLSIPPVFMEHIRLAHGGVPGADDLARLASPSPISVRIRHRGESRERALAALAATGTVATPGEFAPDCMILDSGAILATDAVPSLVIPQDQASQLVAMALGPLDGANVLDMCCGVGIKTSQILDMSDQATVTAVDTDSAKLDRNKELCRAMGLAKPRVLGADATALPAAMEGTFDAVLLDAPCTGAGTIRRRPEVRYARSAADFGQAALLQKALLESALRMVRPGGRVVFATCSFSPTEGRDVLAAVLGARPGYELVETGLPTALESPDHTVTILPWAFEMDGFFIAAIRRCP